MTFRLLQYSIKSNFALSSPIISLNKINLMNTYYTVQGGKPNKVIVAVESSRLE